MYWGAWLSPYLWNWEPVWPNPIFGKQQIDLLKSVGGNCLIIGLDRLSWLRNPEKADYAVQLANRCRPEMKVVAWLSQDSGNWKAWGDPEYLTGQQVMSDPALCSKWIEWGKDVIEKMNPDAIHVMDEPSGVDFETYYNNLAKPSYDAYTNLKPDMLVYVTGCPWYRITQWETKPIERNMMIQFHKYYDPSQPWGAVEYEYLYRDAKTAEDLQIAKENMYAFLDSQIGRLPRRRISFGMGTLGTIEPNWQHCMKDKYDWCKSRGLPELWQFALGPGSETKPNYTMLDWNRNYEALNEVGLLWAENVPTPTPPIIEIGAPVTVGLILTAAGLSL